ncbi:MAG TPA: TetR/AcrR family transcriptional regulator [Syntrophobacter fumaroxidans]|nr:TetR/AcrR family transcriptional regulator [Syntrophobacter fumaroxidans]
MPIQEPGAGRSSVPGASRRRILEQARSHFFTHGFRRVTMNDLATALAMSKKTLYAHFSSKTELVEAVLRDRLQHLEADLDRLASAPSGDLIQELHRSLECVRRHMGEVRPPFVRDIRREAPELFRLVEDRHRDMSLRTFGRILEEGRRKGIIRRDIPTRLIVEILLGAVQAIVDPARMEELDLTPKTAFKTVVAVILEGVVTERGKVKP